MRDGSDYVRACEIAQLLGVSERTIRRLIASGEIPSSKFGGARLVAKADLERQLSPDWKPDEDPDEKEE